MPLPPYSPHCAIVISVSSTRKLALQGQRQCFVDFGAPSTMPGAKCLLNRELTEGASFFSVLRFLKGGAYQIIDHFTEHFFLIY